MFRRKTKIEQLARQTRHWAVTAFDKTDRYWLRTTSGREVHDVLVGYHRKFHNTVFQTWLPIRFSLDNPPSGLFGRLLMRSWDLRWSAWIVNIGESCEATICVKACIPTVALDAKLLDGICQEQTEEVAAFQKELRDKFNWAAQCSGVYPASPAGPGVPMLRQGGPPQRYR